MNRRWLLVGGAAVIAVGLTQVFAGSAAGIVIDGFFINDNNSTFEDDIDAIAEAGITKGCNSAGTRFCPAGAVTRGEMAAFLRRSLSLPATTTDRFSDDDFSQFEADINAIAESGITNGCDPEATNHYCPRADVTRGEMAAFLRRALDLPASATDWFTDDDSSPFEADINVIADAGITKGCSLQPTASYCPTGAVTRGEMAAFLRRSLGLPSSVIQIPIGENPGLYCPGAGDTCTLVVDVDAGRPYIIKEGFFQVLPASVDEMSALQRQRDEIHAHPRRRGAATSRSANLGGREHRVSALGIPLLFRSGYPYFGRDLVLQQHTDPENDCHVPGRIASVSERLLARYRHCHLYGRPQHNFRFGFEGR